MFLEEEILGHTQRHHTEGRLGEDAAKRWPSASQREKPADIKILNL